MLLRNTWECEYKRSRWNENHCTDNYSVKLSNEDILLRKRAEFIIEKFEKTKTEFLAMDNMIVQEVYNGVAETDALEIFTQTSLDLQNEYPDRRYPLFSWNLRDDLENSLNDWTLLPHFSLASILLFQTRLLYMTKSPLVRRAKILVMRNNCRLIPTLDFLMRQTLLFIRVFESDQSAAFAFFSIFLAASRWPPLLLRK